MKQGFATEAVKALVKVGFELEELERIEIRCDHNNIASQGIPKKLSFTHKETLLDVTVDQEGEDMQEMIWAMTKKDYPKEEFANFNIRAYDVANRLIM